MEYKVNERFFESVLKIKAETSEIINNNSRMTEYMLQNINTYEDVIKFIFSGYLDALENGAEIANVDLDMTYETASNIMPAIMALAYFQNKTIKDLTEVLHNNTTALEKLLTRMEVDDNDHK